MELWFKSDFDEELDGKKFVDFGSTIESIIELSAFDVDPDMLLFALETFLLTDELVAFCVLLNIESDLEFMSEYCSTGKWFDNNGLDKRLFEWLTVFNDKDEFEKKEDAGAGFDSSLMSCFIEPDKSFDGKWLNEFGFNLKS